MWRLSGGSSISDRQKGLCGVRRAIGIRGRFGKGEVWVKMWGSGACDRLRILGIGGERTVLQYSYPV